MAISGDLFGCCNWEMVLASSEWMPEILLNVFQCTSQSSLTPTHRHTYNNTLKHYSVQGVNRAMIEKSPVRTIHNIIL